MSAELSGRVYNLEQVQSYIDQQLLLRPDINVYSAYQQSNNAQLDIISDQINNLTAALSSVQSLIINMNINMSSLSSSLTTYSSMLTGHIAKFVTGSSPTHTGGSS